MKPSSPIYSPLKTHTLLSGLLFLCLALLSPPASPAAAPDTTGITLEEQFWLSQHPVIRLAPDPEFAPIEYFDEKGSYQGVAADNVRLLEQKLGIQFTIVRTKNWDEVMEKFRNQEIDLLGAIVPTENRRTFMRISTPLFNVPGAIMVRTSVDESLTFDKLPGMKVAVVSNYTAHDILKNHYPEIQLDVVPNTIAGLSKVSFGMVDAYIENLATASYYLQQAAISNVHVAGSVPFAYQWGIGIRQDWPELESIINKTISRITDEDKHAILNRWLPVRQTWKPSRAFVVGVVSSFVLFLLGGILFWVWSLQKTVDKRTKALNLKIIEHKEAELKIRSLNSNLQTMVSERTSELEKEIIERRQAEVKLRESEKLYRSLVENIDLGVTLIDTDHTIIMANAAQGRLFGKPASSFNGKKCYQEFEKRDARCPHCPGVKAMQNGQRAEAIARGVKENGESFTVRIRAFPIRDEKNKSKGFIEVVEDITAQIQSEEALAAEKERLAVTLRSIGDGVITTNTAGEVIFLNKMAEEITGWSHEEAAGRPLQEVFHIINQRTREVCESPAEKVLRTGKIIGMANHTSLIAKNGAEKSIADSGAPIRDKTGTIIGVVLVFRDVTNQHRMEEELIKAKKLESIGVLAGGIAHDFNNILAGILGYINLSLYDPNLSEETHSHLVEAEKASKRAKDLTKQLLTFSKGGEPVKETSSLHEIIKDSATFVLHGEKIRCHFSIPDDLWLVNVDKGQFSQVIQNLVINACHAMPAGGTIEIECRNVPPGPEQLPLPQDSKSVRISIKDTGIGIQADFLDKIFDPYFSTKQEGSGLGLAITHSIISKHGGHIFVDSIPGQGTTFTVLLPASTFSIAEKPMPHLVTPSQKTATILIMDDEAIVQKVTQAMLKQLGHKALSARDGDEAISLYTNATEPIDIVIMDLTIPGGKGGEETVKEILALNPRAKVVVSSGYFNDPIMANHAKYGFCAAIVKPYQLGELSSLLSKLLDSP